MQVEIVVQQCYMYQFLDAMDMCSLVEKNPKQMGVLEKHNTKISL
jgi:hypothetical protein